MQPDSNKHVDLTEEASKRKGGEEATTVAREVANGKINQDTSPGPVPSPDDDFVENSVSTSDSDE